MSNSTVPVQLRRAGWLALFGAIYTYALIVFGGIVRITGSGMGCGDHWPKCNGVWIPTFTLETFIEYMHRLLAAGIGTVVLGVLIYAFVHRAKPGFGGPGGLLRPLGVGLILFVAQAMLGAITVWLELSRTVTVAHFVMAQVFAATLLVAAVRAGVFGRRRASVEDGGPASPEAARKGARLAMISTGFGIIVILFGALTANTPGAPAACQGFPFCNGSLLPSIQAATVHIHWTHRMLAFLFFFHMMFAAMSTLHGGVSRGAARAALTAAALVGLQLVVAALLIMLTLPESLQALHLAVGVAIWFALVVWTTLARRDALAVTGVERAPSGRAVPALG